VSSQSGLPFCLIFYFLEQSNITCLQQSKNAFFRLDSLNFAVRLHPSHCFAVLTESHFQQVPFIVYSLRIHDVPVAIRKRLAYKWVSACRQPTARSQAFVRRYGAAGFAVDPKQLLEQVGCNSDCCYADLFISNVSAVSTRIWGRWRGGRREWPGIIVLLV
jgi:hypothetical protein